MKDKKRYCERCGEENLDTYVSTDIRPFHEYCSTNCLSNHIVDVRFNKDWADIKEEYKKECITNLFEYAKKQLKKRDYIFYKSNEQKKEYEHD